LANFCNLASPGLTPTLRATLAANSGWLEPPKTRKVDLEGAARVFMATENQLINGSNGAPREFISVLFGRALPFRELKEEHKEIAQSQFSLHVNLQVAIPFPWSCLLVSLRHRKQLLALMYIKNLFCYHEDTFSTAEREG